MIIEVISKDYQFVLYLKYKNKASFKVFYKNELDHFK